MSVTVTQQLTQQTVTVTGNPVDNNVTVTVSNARGAAGPNTITTSTTAPSLTGYIFSNGTTIAGATAATNEATASTLARRDSAGGCQFTDLSAAVSFDAGTFSVDSLTGSTFEAGSSVTFNATAYTYGTGAASAHRIALGAGTTGATLFGAATAAAARTTLGLGTVDDVGFRTVTNTQSTDAATPVNAFTAATSTEAGLNSQKWSPVIKQSAKGWGTTASTSQDVSFSTIVKPTQSTVPTGTWSLQSSIAGGALTDHLTVTSTGTVSSAVSFSAPIYYGVNSSGGILRLDGNAETRGLGIGSLNLVAWSSGAYALGLVSGDTNLNRAAAGGTVQIGTTARNALGSLACLNGTFGGNLTASGFISTTPATQSGLGPLSVTASSIALTTTGVADALTLANGTNGQILTVCHVSRGGGTGTAVLTPTTKNGYTTITFTATGDSVTLQYHITGGWHIIGSRGVTIA